jgi:hypothetical protein
MSQFAGYTRSDGGCGCGLLLALFLLLLLCQR